MRRSPPCGGLLTGALPGVLVGIALAVLLQQHGIWPLDKLAVFLLLAITGLLGMAAPRSAGSANQGRRTR